MTVTVNIAKDFSRNPAGRYKTDGPYSGELFRESLLRPALSDAERVQVDLDGVLGFGSSFLEEAFGGLVRECGMSFSNLKQKMEIKSRIKTYENRIWSYIQDATPARR